MNITLIGMPGSGKSFVGRALAERLRYEIIDFDRGMEQHHGMPLQSLVDSWGAKVFIEREGNFVVEATRGKESCIFSPGGSIVYSPHAMAHLRDISRIVYLRAPLAVIAERIAHTPRGIVGFKQKTLADLYAERTQLYEKYAHVTIDSDDDVKRIADRIIAECGA